MVVINGSAKTTASSRFAILLNNMTSNSALISLVGLVMITHLATLFLDESSSTDTSFTTRSSSGSPVSIDFPPTCTEAQYRKLAAVKPTKDTACPDATWLVEDDDDDKAQTETTTEFTVLWEPSSRKRIPVGIYVGCNKGIDAMDTLRHLSQNPMYDKTAWLEALDLGESVRRGVCKAGETPQVEITASKPRPARLYCIEPMPRTIEHLNSAVEKLAWQGEFRIWHGAVSDSDGSVMFPNSKRIPGYESHGLENNCENRPQNCESVTLTTLDTFVQQHVAVEPANKSDFIIDILSIDAEGFDWAVLQGGHSTLQKTRYVEFEVHKMGLWASVTLETAITTMRSLNFVCYYAGSGGRLWRLTDCMTGPGFSVWSNVACVNLALAPNLALHMEQVFLQTVAE